MKIALIGQPNCGKSTIFNYFSGYKAAVSNFPGTTVKYTVSQVVFEGEEITCVDLPGVYSLTSTDQAELNSRNYLLAGEADVIINVIDASLLGRSLELTLELMSLERPLVVALNMMDEAARKGISIDADKLSDPLGGAGGAHRGRGGPGPDGPVADRAPGRPGRGAARPDSLQRRHRTGDRRAQRPPGPGPRL